MSVSAKKRQSWQSIPEGDQDRIVRMAWEDRTGFDAIRVQFGLSPNEVVKFMRTQLDEKAYKRWRRRANEQGQLKNRASVKNDELRFKCSRQRPDGSTKGWK